MGGSRFLRWISQEFIFLFIMFLCVDVLEVVIQTVQLHKRAFLGLSTVRTEQSHAHRS